MDHYEVTAHPGRPRDHGHVEFVVNPHLYALGWWTVRADGPEPISDRPNDERFGIGRQEALQRTPMQDVPPLRWAQRACSAMTCSKSGWLANSS